MLSNRLDKVERSEETTDHNLVRGLGYDPCGLDSLGATESGGAAGRPNSGTFSTGS
jgi:hypothetical protein